MRDVTTQNLWIFELGCREGNSFPLELLLIFNKDIGGTQ